MDFGGRGSSVGDSGQSESDNVKETERPVMDNTQNDNEGGEMCEDDGHELNKV